MEMEKRNVDIWKTLQKVPAGTMFVPLIIGALITTVCQGIFQFDLWSYLGNPMKDMFSSSGQMLLIGLMLFCTGTSLKLGDLKDAMHRGILLILVRLAVAYALCALFYFLLGYDGILGISFLAFVCAVTSANAALYMGIIQPFGDKSDKAEFRRDADLFHAATAAPVSGLFRNLWIRHDPGPANHLAADPLYSRYDSRQSGRRNPQGIRRRECYHPAVPRF